MTKIIAGEIRIVLNSPVILRTANSLPNLADVCRSYEKRYNFSQVGWHQQTEGKEIEPPVGEGVQTVLRYTIINLGRESYFKKTSKWKL